MTHWDPTPISNVENVPSSSAWDGHVGTCLEFDFSRTSSLPAVSLLLIHQNTFVPFLVHFKHCFLPVFIASLTASAASDTNTSFASTCKEAESTMPNLKPLAVMTPNGKGQLLHAKPNRSVKKRSVHLRPPTTYGDQSDVRPGSPPLHSPPSQKGGFFLSPGKYIDDAPLCFSYEDDSMVQGMQAAGIPTIKIEGLASFDWERLQDVYLPAIRPYNSPAEMADPSVHAFMSMLDSKPIEYMDMCTVWKGLSVNEAGGYCLCLSLPLPNASIRCGNAMTLARCPCAL